MFGFILSKILRKQHKTWKFFKDRKGICADFGLFLHLNSGIRRNIHASSSNPKLHECKLWTYWSGQPLIIHKPQLSYHDWLVNTLENDRDPQISNIFLLMLIQPTKQIKVSLCILMLLKIKIRCNNKAIFFFLLWPTFPHTTHWLFKLSHMRKES